MVLNMSKIILFYPKLEESKEWHYMPISLLAGATTLQGHDLVLIDSRVEPDWQNKLNCELSNADEIRMSVFTGYQLSMAYDVSKQIKTSYPLIKIIWAGPHTTALASQTLLSPYIDDVICGDTDDGMCDLPYYLIDVNKYINPDTKRFIYISSYSCVGNCTFCQTKPRRKLLFLPSKSRK